ncbi:uncharacterized protein [Littorina saxatilis]|uniref:uncharacterized protein n=1 Tax=Littorina saxatilis TaxID=31220 RepID=UPI0038B4607B
MANHVLKFTYMVPWAVLLFLGTVGHKVKRAETSGNGHCSAPSVTDGQQGYLTFNLRQDIQMDAPKFYANLRRATEPAKDILHCDRANQVSTIECGVTDTSFKTDKILKNHRLVVRIPKTTMKYDDLYTLYVYVNGKAETPIACNFTVKAEVPRKDEEKNAWIAALVVIPIIAVVIVAVVICVRRRCNHNPREDPAGDVHTRPLIRSWRKSNDKESHKEKRWYFGTITEEEENKLLQFKRNEQGSFLMRHGHTNPNDYILAVSWNNEIKRLTINCEGERFICCNTNVTFNTLCNVVSHYKKHEIKVGEDSWGKLSKPFEKEPDAEWYFGEISREDERKLLISQGHGSGSYLVRDGKSDKNQYVLAVNFDEQVNHFAIIPDKEETGFKLQNSNVPPFKTLSELVEHYKEHGIESGAHVVKLSKPCTKEQEPVESHKGKRWYFGEMTTEEEEKLLDFQRNVQGSYLVRGGITNPNNYVLSVHYGGEIKRLTICREGDHFKCRNTGLDLKSLCDFVDHYTRNEIKVGANVWGKLLKPFEKKPEHEWYIGKCARSEENTKLLHDGSFFVRDGNSDPHEYVLAAKVKGKIIHLPITQEADGYKLRDAETNTFRTLLDLVEYYTHNDITIGSNVNHGKLLKSYSG